LGETPAKPGLQFQRGIFIVPAALRFVNEGGHELLLEIRSGRVTAAKWLVAGVLCKPLQTGSLSATSPDFCLVPMMAEHKKASIDLLYEK
jgi:hypothetical protein